MRLAAILLALGFSLLTTQPAAADPQRDAPTWAPIAGVSALSPLLRDGYRVSPEARVDRSLRASVSLQTSEEPGEALTAVVERMWSQVRAYRRKGGAEVVLRGRF